MDKNKVYKLAGILFVVTLLLFFGLYFAFATSAKISDENYFNYSWLINSFALPFIYTGVSFYGCYTTAKKEPMKLSTAYKTAFLPMFFGGFLSLAVIFIFLNNGGSWAQDSLQRGWYDMITANPNPEFIEANKELLENMKNPEYKLFTFRNFLMAFSVILFFYFMISIIFAIFFKNRRV